eukprot:TRINITY_DN2783_c1_g2_i3.p1 TRINITY_DN2783_c1_g2~~TRINITY_DN2783_c1_g2_i3.p1  ORF type:complete len:306 (-),score=54.55 TRINITY_DN2783_c1_g2_i3:60-977(-)
MNSQNADYTKRLSISDHDLIIQEVDDGDEEWTSCKESYQALVDDYRVLREKRKMVADVEAKLKKTCIDLKKKLSSYHNPKKEYMARIVSSFCDDTTDKLPSDENGFLLWVVIGKLNVRFGDYDLKIQYKKAYERFKLISNGLAVTVVLLTWFFHIPQIIMYSLLLWYYFTLTIREHILIKNGSKIKSWWLLHHYITIIITMLLLTWPPGDCYTQSHDVLMFSILMTSVIQLVQFFYQRKTIDRNIMMGKDNYLRTTNEGIRSKSMSDLVYIVPILIVLYDIISDFKSESEDGKSKTENETIISAV